MQEASFDLTPISGPRPQCSRPNRQHTHPYPHWSAGPACHGSGRAVCAWGGQGIVDNRLEYHGGIGLGPVETYAEQMGPANLHAKWTRVLAYWDQLQPSAPGVTDPGDLDGDGFNDAYVNELDTVVGALRAQGISVILTGSDPPSWARDTAYKKYWTKNPTTAVVRVGDSRCCRLQGVRLVPGRPLQDLGITHFEVWNEPNLRLLPQIVGKKVVGPEVYRKMLVAFSKAAHDGNPKAVVIAGATSRMGSPGTSAGSTSPQWFARYLKKRGATRWFDAYSHHPYTTRKSAPQPCAKPRRPDISVTLGNLSVLLKLFPTKPFYLTEYCYSTGANDAFVVSVPKADQARYLRQASALLAKPQYRQVKALLWFLVKDWQSDAGEQSSVGVYTGSSTARGPQTILVGVRRRQQHHHHGAGEGPARTRFCVSGTVTTRREPRGKHDSAATGAQGKSWVTAKTATKAEARTASPCTRPERPGTASSGRACERARQSSSALRADVSRRGRRSVSSAPSRMPGARTLHSTVAAYQSIKPSQEVPMRTARSRPHPALGPRGPAPHPRLRPGRWSTRPAQRRT